MPNPPVDRTRLLDELKQFRDIAFPTPAENDPYELALLDTAKDAVVRGRVLLDCALIEELSAIILMHYWLSTDRDFMRRRFFGRVNKYRSLFDALGRLPARQKMTTIKSTVKAPKSVASNVERMLAIRDVLAHVRTFEDEHPGITYKGSSIFSTQGLERYVRDSSACLNWFARKARLLSERGKRNATAFNSRRRRQRAR